MPRLRATVALCLGCGLLDGTAAVADNAQSFDKVSFYFAAHEDDWQLFMNPSAFQDVANPRTKTVFVHMTAGDAGLGTGTGGRKHPYYLARENGADAAIRFMADSDDRAPAEKIARRMAFNGHPIHRVAYRNTVAYYLRVPDGSGAGTGYAQTGYQSLKRLAGGEIKKLSAIDGSTAYRGWTDLTTTIRAILDHERGTSPAVQLNVSETDPAINPGDHSDHLMTAKAALDAAKDLTCARRLHYVDYASSKLPENLTADARDMESSVFAVTLAAVNEFDHTTAWHRYDQHYVGRNYFRIEEANGRCGASGPAMTASKAADGRASASLKNR